MPLPTRLSEGTLRRVPRGEASLSAQFGCQLGPGLPGHAEVQRRFSVETLRRRKCLKTPFMREYAAVAKRGGVLVTLDIISHCTVGSIKFKN